MHFLHPFVYFLQSVLLFDVGALFIAVFACREYFTHRTCRVTLFHEVTKQTTVQSIPVKRFTPDARFST